jgi:hypothetical protein
VKRYLPWQLGLDYDAIGSGSGQELFDEQIDVRDLLRGQQGQNGEGKGKGTEWVIVSTGLFMSFLFEEGCMVDFTWQRKEKKAKAVGLGAWGNTVTVTDVPDAGRVVAEIVLGEGRWARVRDQVVFTEGERITYEGLVGFVEKDLLTMQRLEDVVRQRLDDGIAKYRLVFARGAGASWG